MVHGRGRSGEQRYGVNLGLGMGAAEEEWCCDPGNCCPVADGGWLEGEMDGNSRMHGGALLGWSNDVVRVE